MLREVLRRAIVGNVGVVAECQDRGGPGRAEMTTPYTFLEKWGQISKIITPRTMGYIINIIVMSVVCHPSAIEMLPIVKTVLRTSFFDTTIYLRPGYGDNNQESRIETRFRCESTHNGFSVVNFDAQSRRFKRHIKFALQYPSSTLLEGKRPDRSKIDRFAQKNTYVSTAAVLPPLSPPSSIPS